MKLFFISSIKLFQSLQGFFYVAFSVKNVHFPKPLYYNGFHNFWYFKCLQSLDITAISQYLKEIS